MNRNRRIKKLFSLRHPKRIKQITLGAVALLAAFVLFTTTVLPAALPASQRTSSEEAIKWVDFDVPYPLLEKAMYLDIESYETENHLQWIELLSYLAAKYGGDFSKYQEKDLNKLVEKLNQGEPIEHLTKTLKHYAYYKKAYTAVLGGYLGEFTVQVPVEKAVSPQVLPPDDARPENNGDVVWQSKYGLKAFSPIAQGYWYEDYDDFGAGRSYGYKRKHLGHDLMASVGTPVIAVESGIVEAIGWNQYGGWRIGIRSFDKERYYYYAHLRKDHPYSAGLYEGKAVKAGEVLGYSGRTGYSKTENVNNIDTPHLHLGLQLIFDEKEKDSPSQIWIDLYSLTRLLSKNRAAVYQDPKTKEYYRTYDFSEPNYYQQNEQEKAAKEAHSAAIAAAAAPEDSIPLPIIMYHGITEGNGAAKNKFFVSEKTFEKDLQYLSEHGYTPILMKDLLAFVDTGTPLPEHPIMLTFDDGYYNNYLYAFPLLQKYNAKALFAIIGTVTDDSSELTDNNPNYSYLTWEQVEELASSGLVEIQNHTYNMHKNKDSRQGILMKSGETPELYAQMLHEDIGLLQDKIEEATGERPTTFVYPFGFVKDDAKDILMKELGFRATLTCYEKVNYVTRDPDGLYRLKRILRPPDTPSEEFFRTIAPAHTSASQ